MRMRFSLVPMYVLALIACQAANTAQPNNTQASDGRCGAANNVPAAAAPNTNLCSAGSSSAVTGSGPFYWTCTGSNGGTTVNCWAPLAASGPFPASGWVPLKLGGGGWITGQNVSPAGVRFVRTDVGGAYLWGTNNKWNQVVTQASLPGEYFGYYPANTSQNQKLFGGGGVMEIAACPSDPSCAYLLYGGVVFVSTSVDPANPQQLRWSSTGFPRIEDTANAAFRNSGPFMAVDPHNQDHVIVGTAKDGLRETFNGTASGGATWATIPGSCSPSSSQPCVPLALDTGDGTNYRVAFDPTSATVACPGHSGTCTSRAYVWTSGGSTPGVYYSTDGGGSWTRTSDGPTNVNHLTVSAASAGGGNLWATETGTGYVWRYANGTWAQISSSAGALVDVQAVAVNPNRGEHVAALAANGYLYVSTNGDQTTPTFDGPYAYTLAATDAPWQGRILLNRSYLGAGGGIDFDPLQVSSEVLLAGGGQGMWTTTLPSANFTWTSIIDGVEELIFWRIAVGAPGKPSIGAQDESGCQFDITKSTSPASCFPQSELAFLYFASGLSIAPGTDFMVAKMSQDFGADSGFSGYSTDGFNSDYLPFNTWYAKVAPTAVSSSPNGEVRVAVTSADTGGAPVPTAGLSTWSNGSGSIVCSLTTVLASALREGPCYAVRVVDGTHFDLQGSHYESVMSNTPGTYIFYVSAAPLDDWNGALNVVNVTDHDGLVRVTVATGGYLGNRSPVCLSGVQMSGSTVVNGCWVATNADGNNVDLGPISAFQNGDSYQTNGVLRTWGGAGGSIAAASRQNWTMVGADRTYPYCTTDAGAHWTQVQVPGVPVALTTVTAATANSVTVSNADAVRGNYQIYIPLASGRVFTDTNPGYSGNTITFTHSLPPGDSIQPGAGVSNSTGWPFAAYLNSHPLAADQVEPNTFFAMNSEVGLARWTNCGSVTVVAPANPSDYSSFLAGAGFNETLKTVPGEAGHLFWTVGQQGNQDSTHPAGTRLWRTCNGTSSTSVTLSEVPGFFEPISVGFGAPASGRDYPAIYVVGWYSPGDNPNDALYGVWRSVDDVNHLAAGACSTGNNWTWLGDYPMGWQSFPNDIEGDPFVFGPVYYSGSYGAFAATIY